MVITCSTVQLPLLTVVIARMIRTVRSPSHLKLTLRLHANSPSPTPTERSTDSSLFSESWPPRGKRRASSCFPKPHLESHFRSSDTTDCGP